MLLMKNFKKKIDSLGAIIEKNNKLNVKKYKKIRCDIDGLSNIETNQIETEEFRKQLHEIDTKNKQLKSMTEAMKAQNE